LRVLGHPARLQLIELLAREDFTVTQLARHSGLTADSVSKHLRELASVQLVTRRQDGNFARYSLPDRDVAKLVAMAYRTIALEAQRKQTIAELARRHRGGATGDPQQ
jgi:DNA-binding transcriptional ArsR family regulator